MHNAVVSVDVAEVEVEPTALLDCDDADCWEPGTHQHCPECRVVLNDRNRATSGDGCKLCFRPWPPTATAAGAGR